MKHWILWLITGVIFVVGGFLALTNPLAATLAATMIAAWSFLIGGALQIYAAFNQEGTENKIWPALAGLAGVIVGVLLFKNPLEGVISLTIMVAIMFFVIGVAKVILSFSLKGTSAFWPIMLSGILSVVLSLMIFSNFPQSAATILGILLAVELISNGVSLIMMSLYKKPA